MPIYKVEGARKDGLQKYNVRINFIADNGQAKQLTRTAYGLESAKDLERQLTDKAKSKTLVSKMTIQQLFDEHAAVKQYETRESTLDKSRRIFNYHIAPTFGDVRLDKLTVSMIQSWKLSMEQKNLLVTTKRNAFSELRSVLNYAVKMDYLSKNPLSKVTNFKDVSNVKREMSFYTPQEFTRFIETAKGVAIEKQEKCKDLFEWNYFVFFCIAFYTGLRKGEIYALRWSDIESSHLSVKRSITQKLKGEDRETLPKNNSSVRTLQMPLPLIQILNDHKKRMEKLDGFNDDFRICGGERCLRDTTIQNRNMRYSALAGVKMIRIHDFRHSHVSVLANEGINIQEIARRLGHSKIEITWNTYSHLYPREEERAVEVLNKIA